MGIKYLWDTNICIYYLQQQFPKDAEQFIDSVLKEAVPCISAITEIELLCWKTATDRDQELLGKFIENCIVVELDRGIKLQTAAIRKTHKIKLPDAIIAATALEGRYTLLTRNISDFKNISDIRLRDPWA